MKITKAMIEKLKQRYPDGTIAINSPDQPTEVFVEIARHPRGLWGLAVALIGSSDPHEHHRTLEIYDVHEGELALTVQQPDGAIGTTNLARRAMPLKTVLPGMPHWARGVGKPALVTVLSVPAWDPTDHHLRPDIGS